MPYRATYIEKTATKDVKDYGCDPDTSRCIMSEKINIERDTLVGLLQAIKEVYCYEDNYFYIPESGGAVEFNRYEDDSSNVLDQAGCERVWAKGENVWVCDYYFSIEFFEKRDLTETEIRAAIQEGQFVCD